MTLEEKGIEEKGLEEDISRIIWQISKKLKRSRQRFLESYNLTSSQLEVLGAVFHSSEFAPGEEMTQITISKYTYIDPMTISTIIKNLEKKDLVYRVQSQRDSRALCVCLTEKGKDVSQVMTKVFKQKKLELFKNVDKQKFYNQLTILLENINNNDTFKCD